MKSKHLFLRITAVALPLWLSSAGLASAQATTFTYQGRLMYADFSANGNVDLVFKLFDAASAGNQIGSTITNANLLVTNGLFTATLDFGAGGFPGADRWLEVGVRTNGTEAAFTTLSPRQQLTAAPYSIQAANAASYSGVVGDAQLSANIPRLNGTQTFSGTTTFSGAVNGSGAGLTNLNADNLASGAVPDARLSANVALVNGSQTFSGINILSNAANSFSGSGAGLTSLNASSVTSGALDGARVTDGTVTAGKLAAGVALPAGVMLPYGGATAPVGWYLCDGSEVGRATNAALFAAIGTTYGEGDGSTTFNLPDFRGRVPMGAGTGSGGGVSGSGKPSGGSALTTRTRGDWAGEEKHQLTAAEMPSHAHGTSAGWGNAAAGTSFYAALASTAGCDHTTCGTGAAGGDTPHNILPPFMTANFIIKQ